MRRLFTILSALSLLLFVAVCVLWAVSFRYAVAFQLRHPPRDAANVAFHLGHVYYYESFFSRPQTWVAKFEMEMLHKHPPLETWIPINSFGIAVGHADHRYLALPLWALALLSALPALGVLPRLLRHGARKGAGLCPSCGYDLRATPGRCPECGHSASADEPC